MIVPGRDERPEVTPGRFRIGGARQIGRHRHVNAEADERYREAGGEVGKPGPDLAAQVPEVQSQRTRRDEPQPGPERRMDGRRQASSNLNRLNFQVW